MSDNSDNQIFLYLNKEIDISIMTFKELLDIAKEQLNGLSTLDNPDYRLEQAEYDEEQDAWDIVVSFLVENTNKRTTQLIPLTSNFQYHRLFKRIKITSGKQAELFFYNDK